VTVRHARSCDLSLEERSVVCDLLDESFDRKIFSLNTSRGFFSGYEPQEANTVLVIFKGEIAGVALAEKRLASIGGIQSPLLTVGPLAIRPRFQGCGLGRELMSSLDELAVNSGARGLYLQGIPNFYGRFQYFPVLARSKSVIRAHDLPNPGDVVVRPLRESDHCRVFDLYEEQRQLNSFASVRSERNWAWLTRYAKGTYYFFSPMVIEERGEVIGYFTSDPDAAGRLREAVVEQTSGALETFCRGLARYAKANSLLDLEVMMPPNSPMRVFFSRHLSGCFSEYFSHDGGQVLHLLDPVAEFRDRLQREGLNGFEVWQADGTIHAENRSTFVQLSIDRSDLPGWLSGYRPESLNIEQSGTTSLSHLREPTWGLPFVYQGDNF